MNRFEVEKLYKDNGLNNYKLRNIEDLKKCHGLDVTTIDGYEALTEHNQQIFNNFIVRFFNGCGLDTRMCITFKNINFVEDINCIAQHPDDKECVVSVIRKVTVIKSDGTKKQLHKYENKEYKKLKILKENKCEYLRFEFKQGKTPMWLHITHEGEEWY